MADQEYLSCRREFLFLYDIKMGNPNGDPDENRPRILPDGTHYVTDVRLKRFVRDYLKMKNHPILVDNIEGKTTNLTGRVVHYLQQNEITQAEGRELVNILLEAFIDARLFGSSFAFKKGKLKDQAGKEQDWEPKPEPKTLTGAVQINIGEVLHQAEEVDILGTSIFGSAEERTQGTFTSYYALRYGLIGFSGIANEHSAAFSQLKNEDYDRLMVALWQGVRAAGNTRSKMGQVPRLLVSIEYNPREEFQFGRLHDYVTLIGVNEKPEKAWSSPDDYQIDLKKLIQRIQEQRHRIGWIRYALSPDIALAQDIPHDWTHMNVEDMKV